MATVECLKGSWKERKPMKPSPWDELRYQVAKIRALANQPGQFPKTVDGMKLVGVELDPQVPGRLRFSYREEPDQTDGPR